MSKNTRTFVVSQSLKDQNATNWFYFDLVFLTERTGSTLGRWSQPITYWSPIRAIIPGSPILYHLMPRSNDNATLGTLFASQYDYVILCLNSCTCWRPQNNIYTLSTQIGVLSQEPQSTPKHPKMLPKCSQNAHLNPEYVGLLGFNSHRQMIPALQARTVTPEALPPPLTTWWCMAKKAVGTRPVSPGFFACQDLYLRHETCLIVEPTILNTLQPLGPRAAKRRLSRCRAPPVMPEKHSILSTTPSERGERSLVFFSLNCTASLRYVSWWWCRWWWWCWWCWWWWWCPYDGQRVGWLLQVVASF